jgi:GNAT superfamily N-acetyltransferase
LIECQGEYWHSLRKAADAAKFTYINEYFPDYKIVYLWERDFFDIRIVKQRLIRELFEGNSPIEQTEFNFEDVTIKKLDTKILVSKSFYSAPEEFLQAFHYAGYGRSAKIVYGAYLNDVLIGVCKFAPPMRAESATSMGFTQSQVLELDRFCIHPQYKKKNFASWMISRCTKLAFAEYDKVVSIYSFADSTFGHFGTVYKAANWKLLHTVPPDYYYLSQEGFVIHKKTLYDHAKRNKFSESEYAIQNSYLKMFGKEKIKFALYRDNKLNIN